MKKRIAVLDDLLPPLQEACFIIEHDKTSFIFNNITEIPQNLAKKIGTMSLDVNHLKSKVSNLMLDVSISKQGLLTYEAIYTVAANIDSKIKSLETSVKVEKEILEAKVTLIESKLDSEKTNLESKLDSEKIKTIELLTIFTAVMSFIIISGTAATKMDSFNVAMPVLGGLALVLLFFISVVSLLLEKDTGWETICRKPKFIISVVLGFLILALAIPTYYITVKEKATNQGSYSKISIMTKTEKTQTEATKDKTTTEEVAEQETETIIE